MNEDAFWFSCKDMIRMQSLAHVAVMRIERNIGVRKKGVLYSVWAKFIEIKQRIGYTL